MSVPLSESVVLMIGSALITAYSFYVLTRYRLKKVEEKLQQLETEKADIHSRLVRLETKIDMLLDR